jgi:hypothetical protein
MLVEVGQPWAAVVLFVWGKCFMWKQTQPYSKIQKKFMIIKKIQKKFIGRF